MTRYAKYAGQGGRVSQEEKARRRSKWSELTAPVHYEKARRIGRHDWDAGTKVHVVNVQTGRALCGAQPGKTSGGWREELDESVQVTCLRCAESIARKERSTR